MHLAREATKHLKLDRVIFVPAYSPPHKQHKLNQITPASDRLAMLRLALKRRKSFHISRIELNKKRKIYTIETIRALRRYLGKKHELFLLTGADNIQILKTWKQVDKIMELATFVIARRPGYSKREMPKGVLWLPIAPFPASATELRHKLQMKQSVRGLLPPQVLTYIRAHKLYREAAA